MTDIAGAEEFYDDLADVLDYFEARSSRRVGNALGSSRPKSNTTTPRTKPTAVRKAMPVGAATTSQAVREEGLGDPTPTSNGSNSIHQPVTADFSFVDGSSSMALPWRSVRREPLGLAELALLPVVDRTDAAQCDRLEEDLFQDKVERSVHSLARRQEDKVFLRKVFREHRDNKSRIEILALLAAGRTATEIFRIGKVRQRCRAAFLELSPYTLFGAHCGGGNTTVSWKLAESLWDKGLYQREELYQFFRRLCDYFETDRTLFRVFGGVLSYAPYHLRGEWVVDHTRPVGKAERRLDHIWNNRPWWGEGLTWTGKRGRPIVLVTSATARPQPSWEVDFTAYPKPSVVPLELEDALKHRLFVESPVSLNALRTGITGQWFPSRQGTRALDEFVSQGLVERIADDYWWRRDLEYLRAGGRRVPRLPRGNTPEYHEASLFDIGLGLWTLHKKYRRDELAPIVRSFFECWGRTHSSGEHKRILYASERYYGELVTS